MKRKLIFPLVLAAALVLPALATGSAVFLLPAVLLVLLPLVSLLSVRWALATMTIETALSQEVVHRGEDISIEILVMHRGLLPIAPVRLNIDGAEGPVRLRNMPGKQQRLSLPFHAVHVGAYTPGLRSVEVRDIFGLYAETKELSGQEKGLLVFPLSFETEAARYAPGDSGTETMARATEDVTNPADVRSYQPGDAMKKIHWKLSLRKGELMVRRFEEPLMSEALILMDSSQPPAWGNPDAAADIRDALLETAASLTLNEGRAGHGVRLPLMGQHPVECEYAMGTSLLLENLARHDFSESDRFERVLLLETRRIRQVGAALVIAARLNGAMVDMMIRMRRMGPYVRFYLITFNQEDERIAPMVSRLQQGDVEVRFIKPRRI